MTVNSFMLIADAVNLQINTEWFQARALILRLFSQSMLNNYYITIVAVGFC